MEKIKRLNKLFEEVEDKKRLYADVGKEIGKSAIYVEQQYAKKRWSGLPEEFTDNVISVLKSTVKRIGNRKLKIVNTI